MTSSDDERQRKLIRKPAYAQDIEKIRRGSARAAEAVAAFERLIRKIADQGMAAPGGRPGVRAFPFHTDHGSYLVLYTLDARKVVCLAVRPVRSGIF